MLRRRGDSDAGVLVLGAPQRPILTVTRLFYSLGADYTQLYDHSEMPRNNFHLKRPLSHCSSQQEIKIN